MCEANAYFLKNGEEELLMEAVDVIEPEDGGYLLVSIFGEQKVVRGDIKTINLVKNRIVFQQQ